MDFGITKFDDVVYKKVTENLDYMRIQDKMI